MRTDVIHLDGYVGLTGVVVEFYDAKLVNGSLDCDRYLIKNTKTGNTLVGKNIGLGGYSYSRKEVLNIARELLKKQLTPLQPANTQPHPNKETPKMVNLDLKNKQYIIATQNYAFMTEKGNEDLYYQLEDHDVQLDKVTAIIEVGSYELIGTKFQMVAVQ